ARGNVVRGIESKIVPIAVADLFGMESPELSVGTCVTEVERELLGLDVNMERIRFRRRKVHSRPDLRANEGESENLDSDHEDHCDDEEFRAAGERLDL